LRASELKVGKTYVCKSGLKQKINRFRICGVWGSEKPLYIKVLMKLFYIDKRRSLARPPHGRGETGRRAYGET
jgi:hypothetical protein